MKRSFIIFAFLLFISLMGCEQKSQEGGRQAESTPIDLKKIEEQLRKEQYEYAEAWCNKDMDAISRIWAHDDDIIILGAEKRKPVIGWEGPNGVKNRYQNSFNSKQKIDFKIHNLRIKVCKSGTAAFIIYDVESTTIDNEGNESTSRPRITVVRELRDGAWKNIHAHSSFSIPEIQAMK